MYAHRIQNTIKYSERGIVMIIVFMIHVQQIGFNFKKVQMSTKVIKVFDNSISHDCQKGMLSQTTLLVSPFCGTGFKELCFTMGTSWHVTFSFALGTSRFPHKPLPTSKPSHLITIGWCLVIYANMNYYRHHIFRYGNFTQNAVSSDYHQL